MPADAIDPSAEMTFLEHLEEFRRRVIVSLITVGFFMLISLSFGKPIERILRLPLDLSTNVLLASLIDKINGPSASFFGFLARKWIHFGSPLPSNIDENIDHRCENLYGKRSRKS